MDGMAGKGAGTAGGGLIYGAGFMARGKWEGEKGVLDVVMFCG